ncbi:MAG TPA: hypothetical protein VH395_16185 [Jatrophihabitantaceae bacterium]|jgi:hypothetical protein
MNHYTTSQLAEIRRQELTADAGHHRHIRRHPNTRSRRHPRRPLSAFYALVDAAQL